MLRSVKASTRTIGSRTARPTGRAGGGAMPILNGLPRSPVGCLLVVALWILATSGPAWSRVGVTSVVDGEPRGKPPSAAERVLHIGNDMTADEVVTTRANDRAHIVFLDGSTLTVGPDSIVTLDKFVYDPEKRTGEMALNAGRGVFRFDGAAISKNSEGTITTPNATMG